MRSIPLMLKEKSEGMWCLDSWGETRAIQLGSFSARSLEKDMLSQSITKMGGFRELDAQELHFVSGGQWQSQIPNAARAAWQAFLDGMASQLGSEAGNAVADAVVDGLTDEGEQIVTSQFDPGETTSVQVMLGDGTNITMFEAADGVRFADYDGDGFMDTMVKFNQTGDMFVNQGYGWRFIDVGAFSLEAALFAGGA